MGTHIKHMNRGDRVYSAHCSVGIVQPIDYHSSAPAMDKLLSAVHTTTDGAFYAIPTGAQAVSIAPRIRTIEKYAASKKGGIFDMRKLAAINARVFSAGQHDGAVELAPISDDFGPLDLVPQNGGYAVHLVFGKEESFSRAVKEKRDKLSAFMLSQTGCELREEDCFALELAADTSPRMPIGFIAHDALDTDLRQTIETDPYDFIDTIRARAEHVSDGDIDLEPLTVCFDALQLRWVQHSRWDS